MDKSQNEQFETSEAFFFINSLIAKLLELLPCVLYMLFYLCYVCKTFFACFHCEEVCDFISMKDGM